MPTPRPIELLAPARDAATALVAIEHGADAVYIGASSHGARAAAANSVDDIAYVVERAHKFGARVYATVNTIVYDSELLEVEKLIHSLYRVGTDALIVQDMGLLRLDLPPIALHASTQCDTRGPKKAKFLQDVGFSQIVLARELSLDEIARVAQAVSVPLEAFVHGALCVSYSGDCHASWALKGRSSNRGECAQICRLPWTLTDGAGRPIEVARGRHLLSLRDMNRSANIMEMLRAGVSSFKIEGRLKDPGYVKNVVAAYRRAIDDAVAAAPDLYARSSMGRSTITFKPDLAKSFNRGYTDYFLHGKGSQISSMASPKSVGVAVGTVERAERRRIVANLTAPLSNGDGLGYYGPDGEFMGFRLNSVDGKYLYPAGEVDVAPGTILMRNRDKAWDDALEGDTARRCIDVEFGLRRAGGQIVIDASCERGNVTVAAECERIEAKTPQQAHRASVLSKLGDTVYAAASINDTLGDEFVAASVLTRLRREAVKALDAMIAATHPYDYRRKELPDAELPQGRKLTYHDNVANAKAREFYRDHGAAQIAPALECGGGVPSGTRVMTTRYCLRRELGACLLTPGASRLPKDLRIENGKLRLRLEFDCENCRMKVLTT